MTDDELLAAWVSFASAALTATVALAASNPVEGAAVLADDMLRELRKRVKTGFQN